MHMSITGFGSITQQTKHVPLPAAPLEDPRMAFFDHHAPTWDDKPDEVARTLQRLTELRDQIGLHPGRSVLEIGCGTGRITGWIAEQVQPGRVVAVDFSLAMLARAQARTINADFRPMDICGEIATDERFDVVFCFRAFPHFRDPLRALRNIRSLLHANGQVVILHLASSMELNHFHSKLAHPVCHDHLPPSEAWPGMLANADLSLVSLLDEPGLYLLKAVAKWPPSPSIVG